MSEKKNISPNNPIKRATHIDWRFNGDSWEILSPSLDEHGNFVGHEPRECRDHRTVGIHRAWCYDCSEWCYPRMPCIRCEIIPLRKFAEEHGYPKDGVVNYEHPGEG